MKITAKQMRFANEYMIDFNKVRAAKAAGYCSQSAKLRAEKLLEHPEIKDYIAKNSHQNEDITPERVLKELARIAFSNAADYTRIIFDEQKKGEKQRTSHIEYIPTDAMSDDVKATIVSIRDTKDGIRIDAADKFRALELLGKHFGLFSDKNETTMQLSISDEDKALLERVDKRHAENH